MKLNESLFVFSFIVFNKIEVETKRLFSMLVAVRQSTDSRHIVGLFKPMRADNGSKIYIEYRRCGFNMLKV